MVEEEIKIIPIVEALRIKITQKGTKMILIKIKTIPIPIHDRSHQGKEEEKIKSLENLTVSVIIMRSMAILLVNL